MKQKKYNIQLNEIEAYHGSAIDFDKFNVEYIGTGEGAQAHGWGLYFALKDSTAKGYNEKLSNKDYFQYNNKVYKSGSLMYLILKYIYNYKDNEVGDKLKEIFNSKEFRTKHPKINDSIINRIIKGVESIDRDDIDTVGGQIFKVEIPDLDYFLDENLPLSKQSDYVKECIEKLQKEYAFPQPKIIEFQENEQKEAKIVWNDAIYLYNKYGNNMERFRPKVEKKDGKYIIYYFNSFNYNNIYSNTTDTGKMIYKRLSNIENSVKKASQVLDNHGIKGIKYNGYQDGNCVVIFNDENIKILKKYHEQPKSAIKYYSSNEEYIINDFIYNFNVQKPYNYIKDKNGIIKSLVGCIYVDDLINNGIEFSSYNNNSISQDTLHSILYGESWIDYNEDDYEFNWKNDFDEFNSILKNANIPLTMEDIYNMYNEDYINTLPIDLQQSLSQIIDKFDNSYNESIWMAYDNCIIYGTEKEAYKDCINQITNWYPFLTNEREWSNNLPNGLCLKFNIDLSDIKNYLNNNEEYNNFWEYWNEKYHDYYDNKLVISQPYYGWYGFDDEIWKENIQQAAQQVIEIYNDYFNNKKY